MKRYTDFADRQTILRLRGEGLVYNRIAQETGWSSETVRKVCRAGKPQSERRLGRPATGRLQSFDPRVRYACLRIKLRHPRWGLPGRIQTDRERILVPEGEYPYPSVFTLWLAGLGIEHEIIRRVIQNGRVERSHRTRFD